MLVLVLSASAKCYCYSYDPYLPTERYSDWEGTEECCATQVLLWLTSSCLCTVYCLILFVMGYLCFLYKMVILRMVKLIAGALNIIELWTSLWHFDLSRFPSCPGCSYPRACPGPHHLSSWAVWQLERGAEFQKNCGLRFLVYQPLLFSELGLWR